MKQAKSNIKILKQSINNNNNKKTNIFIKSAANLNTIKTTNSKNKKNYFINGKRNIYIFFPEFNDKKILIKRGNEFIQL